MRMTFTRRFYSVVTTLAIVAFTFFSNTAHAQDAKAGKKLFKQYCGSCHKLDKAMTGPALAGVTDKYEQEWLIKWIRNNVELRNSGDELAIQVYEENDGKAMSIFPQLTDENIIDILQYTIEGDGIVIGGGEGNTSYMPPPPPKDNSVYILLGLLVFLLLLLVLLARVKNTLKTVKGEETTTLAEDTIFIARHKRTLMILLIVGIIFTINGLWNGLTVLGVSEGYQPEQPINFSHKIHAGDNQVDCNYCHSSARLSKTSGIPSANVCMNCHKYIQEGVGGNAAGTAEIQKIYTAIGFDPEKGEYIENYEEQPIKWVRIHNLPDLAYFNHSQHVVAGQVECQTCHGPIETMDVVYQENDLTMGWCVNCHRETEVKMKDNKYYDDLHAQLKEKYKGEKITVDMIGGLECGKCHY